MFALSGSSLSSTSLSKGDEPCRGAVIPPPKQENYGIITHPTTTVIDNILADAVVPILFWSPAWNRLSTTTTTTTTTTTNSLLLSWTPKTTTTTTPRLPKHHHHQQQYILASSVTRIKPMDRDTTELLQPHSTNYNLTGTPPRPKVTVLCQDQRGPLEHLRPTQIIKGAIRVFIQQMATLLSQFLNDQLKQDMMRDDQLQKGEIDDTQARELAQEWNEKEWSKRMQLFPGKFITAYWKYHAVTAMMRFYEYLASRNLDMVRLDRLTLDPFAAAKRREKQGKTVSMTYVARECWTANLITYLADYSIHQIILVFGYYIFIRDFHHSSSQKRKLLPPVDENKEEPGEEDTLDIGSLGSLFLKRSTILAFSRLVCLTCASLGGAIGSALIPSVGWGVLIGINMGDGLGAQITEELVHSTTISTTNPSKFFSSDRDNKTHS